jgi:hypothetical protein
VSVVSPGATAVPDPSHAGDATAESVGPLEVFGVDERPPPWHAPTTTEATSTPRTRRTATAAEYCRSKVRVVPVGRVGVEQTVLTSSRWGHD